MCRPTTKVNYSPFLTSCISLHVSENERQKAAIVVPREAIQKWDTVKEVRDTAENVTYASMCVLIMS